MGAKVTADIKLERRYVNFMCKKITEFCVLGDWTTCVIPEFIDTRVHKLEETTIHLIDTYNLMNNYDNSECETESDNENTIGFRVFICALIYIERFVIKNPWFILSNKNFKRLFMTAFMISEKYSIDDSMTNVDYASIFDMDVDDLNKCERTFCRYMDFDFRVSNELYMSVLDSIDI